MDEGTWEELWDISVLSKIDSIELQHHWRFKNVWSFLSPLTFFSNIQTFSPAMFVDPGVFFRRLAVRVRVLFFVGVAGGKPRGPWEQPRPQQRTWCWMLGHPYKLNGILQYVMLSVYSRNKTRFDFCCRLPPKKCSFSTRILVLVHWSGWWMHSYFNLNALDIGRFQRQQGSESIPAKKK